MLKTKRNIFSMDNPLDNAAQYLDHLKKTAQDPRPLLWWSLPFFYMCAGLLLGKATRMN